MNCSVQCGFNCGACDIGSKGGALHQEIVKTICLLGRKHGLCPSAEWTPPSYSGGVQPEEDEYSPQIDVVWFVDVSKVIGEPNFEKFSSIVSSWTEGKVSRESLRFIPYAAFEVEVSDPTSKTIYSDLHNLVLAKAVTKFEVIREAGDMNLERADRIRKSAVRFCGATDVFILTTEKISEFIKVASYEPYSCKIIERKGSVSEVQRRLLSIAANLNLDGKVEFTPPECQNLEDIYEPRLDAAWLVPVPKTSSDFMNTLIKSCSGTSTSKDLCHLTLVGFEYERETGQKHIAGGVANLSRHFHIGFLITPDAKVEKAKRIVNKYSLAFGFNNVFVLNQDALFKEHE